MKPFFLYNILPLFIVVVIICYLYKSQVADNYLPPDQKYHKQLAYPAKQSGYYKSLDSVGACSDLIYALSNNSIVMFGSSEFEIPSAALPYRFIPQYTNSSALTIGSAGSQSLCIYNELAAFSNLLDSSKIVIFISPLWFTGVWGEGTSLHIFLKNNSIFLSSSLLSNPDLEKRFKQYIYDYVAFHNRYIINPSVELQEMNYLGLPQNGTLNRLENIRNQIGILPVKDLVRKLVLQDEYMGLRNDKIEHVLHVPFAKDKPGSNVTLPYAKNINWDSLYSVAIATSTAHVNNNSLGIYDESYKILAERTDSFQFWEPTDAPKCREFQDLKMLLSLLKTHHSNASFVIVPVNPYYFKKIDKWGALIGQIDQEIHKNNFDCLNLFTDDTALYQKPILRDEQHFGDLGWYKVNHFIIDKYMKK